MIPIRVRRVGGMGNTMFQYMLADRLRAGVPGSRIVNVDLPEFGICLPDVEMPDDSLHIDAPHDVNLPALAYGLNAGIFAGVELGAYAQRLEYYGDHFSSAALFPEKPTKYANQITERTLVINVRGGEVLRDLHPDYGPVPVSFFEQVVEQTGLEPLLVGQLGNDSYSQEIRRRFDGATVLESRSAAEDFELVRSAVNLVFGVSTFSWMAGWLSRRATAIYMPLAGIFSPRQRPDIDLLPVADTRYHFFDLPEAPWSASPEQMKAILTGSERYEELTHDAVRAELRRAQRAIAQRRLQVDPSALNALQRQKDRTTRRVEELSMRLANVKGWSSFIPIAEGSGLDLPRTAPEVDIIRARLTSDPRVSYRLRLRGEARNVSVAVDVHRPKDPDRRAAISQLANLINAELAEGESGDTLIMAAAPIEEAASRLKTFVERTAPLARRG